jgi:hypothetical protein
VKPGSGGIAGKQRNCALSSREFTMEKNLRLKVPAAQEQYFSPVVIWAVLFASVFRFPTEDIFLKKNIFPMR